LVIEGAGCWVLGAGKYCKVVDHAVFYRSFGARPYGPAWADYANFADFKICEIRGICVPKKRSSINNSNFNDKIQSTYQDIITKKYAI
jgi:hypothetical protein